MFRNFRDSYIMVAHFHNFEIRMKMRQCVLRSPACVEFASQFGNLHVLDNKTQADLIVTY